MIKNKLNVGTQVTFYPVVGASYQCEGVIVRKTNTGFHVFVTSGIGSDDGKGKTWFCFREDITSAK